MAFNVRIFGYRGTKQLRPQNPKVFSSNVEQQLVEPYEWGALLVCDGATVVSSAAQPDPDKTEILKVEVPDGQKIRYEINPPTRQGGVRNAGNTSPEMAGTMLFDFHQGWTFSCVDAASFP